jgi:heme oxygenase
MNEDTETLHQTLKKQTIELHDKAHKIPYIKNFMKSTISLESYVGHLRAIAILYGSLEYQLSQLKNQEIKDILVDYTPKLPLILADLEYFKAENVRDIIPSVNHALQVADRIMMYSGSPFKLLGILYTLESSLNDWSVFKKQAEETFQLKNGEATNYFGSFDDRFKNFRGNFIQQLNTHITENKQNEEVISGAGEVFHDLLKIYELLFPADEKTLGNHLVAINPEAGNFPIPTDPREIHAAITAGIDCWNTFPYYEKRYKERGRRFTSSDAVWLVTLIGLSDENILKQVNWLANFLAIRGMPTYTMEIQLQLLYTGLTKQISENESKYRKLKTAAGSLKSKRLTHISEAGFEKSNSIFEKHFQELLVSAPICREMKQNTGKLIACSIADDKNGIPDAKSSLENWLKNKETFPDNWISAVENTYTELEKFINA